jgi:hypothetical protein
VLIGKVVAMFRKSVIALIVALSSAVHVAVAAAEMHVSVDSDRIRIGTSEWVPRFLDLPRVLSVPAGKVTTLPADSTWDYIEVAGTLRVSRDADTTVRFTHLIVLPGGVLDVGTADDPVRRNVEFVIRDVPIDTTRDPFQWGNGLLNFGTQTRVGQRKTGFVELAADAEAGTTTLRLAEAPEGWQVGDELLLPDTRQVAWEGRQVIGERRDPATVIASINGTVVTLAQPLGFARTSIRTPDGELVLRPRVANLTRNIVVRSENPTGVRGHTANIGHGAMWDIRYNAFAGLGRTRNEHSDNTPPDHSRIGTNQLGRYPDHNHHVGSATGSRSIGNAYRGDGRTKWALVVHQTDEVLVENNVCVGVRGSCFVTEDGNEARNTFRRNFAAYVVPSRLSMVSQTQADFDGICPGCEGAGFWFRGVHQTIEGNEAWNNAQGINLVFRALGPTAGPMPVPAPMTIPVLFRGNVTASNHFSGLEYWGMPRFPTENHIAAHNGRRQISISGPPGSNVFLRNLTAVASEARSTCLEGSVGYVPAVEVVDSRMLGCAIGASEEGIAIEYAIFRNVVMQNRINFNTASQPYVVKFENVMHKPLGAFPPRYIVFGESADIWSPNRSLPRGAMYLWNTQRGSQHEIINWQGTGKNYVLLLPGQRSDAPAWPAWDPVAYADLVPEAGLTMGQAWRKYGMSLRGDVIEDADAVTLEGLVNGVAREGLERPLGVPRSVLTSPSMIGRPLIDRGRVKLIFVLTGRRDIATALACFKVNNGASTCARPGDFKDVVDASVPLTELPPGLQTVTTWRQTEAGVKVPESDLTFQFPVGTAASPSAAGGTPSASR